MFTVRTSVFARFITLDIEGDSPHVYLPPPPHPSDPTPFINSFPKLFTPYIYTVYYMYMDKYYVPFMYVRNPSTPL